jgi:mRNA-degrading endonuclease RelE of RelBE toxin-antitoxin system
VKILQTPTFRRATKHLRPNQRRDLGEAIETILENPAIGEQKSGDLVWLRVFKFRMVKQLTLLAYERQGDSIILHDVGSHENFYRDLKS